MYVVNNFYKFEIRGGKIQLARRCGGGGESAGGGRELHFVARVLIFVADVDVPMSHVVW